MEIRRGAFTFTPGRIAQVAVVVLLGVIGALLPYLTLGYEDYSSRPVRETLALWPASSLLSVLNLVYLPSTATDPDALQRGVDLVNLGAHAHQVALVAAVLTGWGLFMDEINKFLWWPLHLAGWVLIAGAVSLWIGWALLRAVAVDVALGPGWVPLVLCGVAALVITFRARSRLDSYRGV